MLTGIFCSQLADETVRAEEDSDLWGSHCGRNLSLSARKIVVILGLSPPADGDDNGALRG